MGRRTLAMYWWCCQCASGPWNVSIYSHCVDCQHARKWTCCKPDKLGANFDLIPTLQASSTASTSQSEDVLSNEPRSVPQSPASRAGKLQDLKIQINGVTTLAVPDTGAHVNALPLSTISLLGEHIDRYHDQTASVCTGKTTILASAFYVRVRYFVRRMPKRKARKCRVIFYVFEQFASGVSAILGQEFLKSHGILTKYAGLLSDRMPLEEAFDIPRCLSINSFTNGTLHYRIFKVFLNENPVHATPDTGSEVNLITLAFASLYSDFGEFRFEPTNPSNPPRIQFVDGAIYEVHFAVKLRVAADRKLLATQTTMVRYDSEKPIVEGPSQPREGECFQKGWVQEFFVVEGLAHDVILGQHTLYAMDAFNSYNHLFESSSDGSAPEMDVIRKCDKTPAKPDDGILAH